MINDKLTYESSTNGPLFKSMAGSVFDSAAVNAADAVVIIVVSFVPFSLSFLLSSQFSVLAFSCRSSALSICSFKEAV